MFKFKRTRNWFRKSFLLDSFKSQHEVFGDIVKYVKETQKVDVDFDAKKATERLTTEKRAAMLSIMRMRQKFFLTICVLACIYTLILFFKGDYASAIVSISLSVVMGMYVFRYHHWAQALNERVNHLTQVAVASSSSITAIKTID